MNRKMNLGKQHLNIKKVKTLALPSFDFVLIILILIILSLGVRVG